MMAQVTGLSGKQVERVRGRLGEFAAEMFESMVRKDLRRWGETYLRGLMLDGTGLEPGVGRSIPGVRGIRVCEFCSFGRWRSY